MLLLGVGIITLVFTCMVKVFSNELNSEIAVNNVQKTDSTSCKFVGFSSETVMIMMK